MRRALVTAAASALLAIVLACGTAPRTPCGDETCTSAEVCLQQCNARDCSLAMPSSGQCPAGYVADTGSNGPCCALAAPPPHCVVPAQATEQDCAPYGQLMFRQPSDPNAPPVFCGCLA